MKRIKKIVLKDATKLTNSEMKQIRGGYEPERSAVCSVQCYNSSITKDCSSHELRNLFCAPISGAGYYGVGCYADTQTGIALIDGTEVYCEDPILFK